MLLNFRQSSCSIGKAANSLLFSYQAAVGRNYVSSTVLSSFQSLERGFTQCYSTKAGIPISTLGKNLTSIEDAQFKRTLSLVVKSKIRQDKQTSKATPVVKNHHFDPSQEGSSKTVPPLPALSWNTVYRALLGNGLITLLKFLVYYQTGSSAMLSEAIHTLADCGNQALLLAGLRQASNAPDKRHQYGYGRAAFFWALVSALGMFWTGAGVSLLHGVNQLMHPPDLFETSNSLWIVLGISFGVDGYVLWKTLQEIRKIKPASMTMREYISGIRDPFVLAVILEDFAACTGVMLALSGVSMTQATGNIMWDSLASVGIGSLLALVALRLVRMNQQFLLGQAVDKETLTGIRAILSRRPAVDAVYAVQSQWVGPSTFAYKAEVDFDGTYLAAQLQEKYAPLFQSAKERTDVEILMGWYAEDVTRLVEREVKDIEREIREHYPAAAYIELEPDSRESMDEALPNDVNVDDMQAR